MKTVCGLSQDWRSPSLLVGWMPYGQQHVQLRYPNKLLLTPPSRDVWLCISTARPWPRKSPLLPVSCEGERACGRVSATAFACSRASGFVYLWHLFLFTLLSFVERLSHLIIQCGVVALHDKVLIMSRTYGPPDRYLPDSLFPGVPAKVKVFGSLLRRSIQVYGLDILSLPRWKWETNGFIHLNSYFWGEWIWHACGCLPE